MPFPFASLLPTAGALIGGLFDNESDEDIARWNTDVQREINQENIAQQSYWNQIAINEARYMADRNENFTREMDALNYGRQMDAAQNSILWRVQDAQRAGVHPLYALGAGGAAISPSMVVGGGSPASINTNGASVAPAPRQSRSNWGGTLSQMGQDISRAVMSADTREQREEKQALAMYDRTMWHLNVDKAGLENDLLRSQIARLQRDQIGSPAPAIGAKPGDVVALPSQPVVGAKGEPYREPGHLTDTQFHWKSDGGIGITKSADMKNRTEDDFIETLGWNWRNRVIPFLKRSHPPKPPVSDLPKGATSWEWSFINQAFYPKYPKRKK